MTEGKVWAILEQERFEGVKAESVTEFPRSEIERLSPTALAYVGDAVYELYMRTRYLLPPKRISVYHQEVVAQVRAESQARQLRSLQAHLSEDEQRIARRGRNGATRCPSRLPREIYQQATSLETLIGYLYLTNPQRLQQLWAYLDGEPP